MLKNGHGELVVSRRPTTIQETDASQYLPCTMCLGWFYSRNLPLHARTCPAGVTIDSNHLRNSRMLIAPYISTHNDEVQELILQMNETKKYPGLRQVSQSDALIKEFAKGLLQKLGSKDEQRLKDKDNIRTKVRHVARLLVALKEKSKEITDLDSAITPSKFFLVVDTVKDISQQCDSPKLGTTLGHYLKQISMLKKSLALISSDETKHKQATDFGTLFDTHWNSYVSAVVNRRIKLRTINKDVKIPQTSDLVVFKDFLDEEIRKFVLRFPLSCSDYGKLSKMLLVRIALFNKRRISEVAELKVSDYSNRLGSSVNDEVLQQLDFTEKILVKRMELIEVRGKSTRGLRKVFIVLTPEMIEACEHLLKTKYHSGQSSDNPYFFSRKNSLSPIDGCTAMREITALCKQIKEPDLIRSRLLRRYMATTIQILDMSRDELGIVADHMGHSVAVHTDVYRMQTSLQEKTKVARALIALENGQLSKFSGKPLSSVVLEQLPIPITSDEPFEGEESNLDIIENDVQNNDLTDTNQAQHESIVPETPIFTGEVVSSTVVSEGILSKTQTTSRKRKRWDANEENILFKAFKSSFEKRQNPSVSEIIAAQNKFSELKNRSVPVIKSKVNNILLGKCKML